MNKKFSTLMAGLMLASAFSVNAANEQPSKKYEDGKYYLLGTNDGTNKFITVNSQPGVNYGTLSFDDNGISGLLETREALWKVTVVPGNVGEAPKFAFQNVATGLYLNLSENNLNNLQITGSYQEWNNGVASATITEESPLMTYVGADKVIYFWEDTNGALKAGVGKPADVNAGNTGSNGLDISGSVVTIQPYKADIVTNLSAEALNKELDLKADDEGNFKLSFNKDVTEGASANLFAATELKAIPSPEATGYVRLQAKDVKVDDAQAYIVVDTAYYAGSENRAKLVKFTYAALNEDAKHPNGIYRYKNSYDYKFSYDPTEDRLLIQSRGYLIRTDNGKPRSITDNNELAYEDYEYTRYTAWGVTNDNAANVDNYVAASGEYAPFVRLAELSTVRELTVSDRASESTIEAAKDPDKGMNTTVKIGTQIAYEPTTIEDGLYMIKLAKNDVRTAIDKDAVVDDYYIANLGGAFGYIAQAKNQEFEHMPAAQWYVKKDGTSNTARISIVNREFSDKENVELANLQAFKGGDGRVFFTTYNDFNWGLSHDTLEFVKVDAEIAKDAKLGYKYVSKEDASVQIYNFNYLHGLTLENGLNTPVDKDSLVRVDETGEKAAFRLIPVVVDDSYGFQSDEKKTGVANLVRNVYYVQAYDNSKFEGDRYLKYDEASKKYVMSKYAQPFFLKENNDVDGAHYYALVEAKLLGGVPAYYEDENGNVVNIVYGYYDEDGEPIVMDDSKNIALYTLDILKDELNRLKIDDMPSSPTNDPQSPKSGDLYALYNKSIDNVNNAQVGLWQCYFINEGVNQGKYGYEQVGGYSSGYAYKRVSVDDNTLDLTIANINDKWTSEIRVSAFAAEEIDSPLYRRFNGANGEFGTAENAPLNLKFHRYNNDQEYLFENYSSENKYRDGITDNSISFLGVNNAMQFAENETRSYTMFVDTAYVRENTRMPQYLIGVKPEVVLGDTTWCNATSAHHHDTLADSLACDHTVIDAGFTRAMYLFNAQDSVDVKNYDYQGKAAYGAQGYTRLAFKDAVHAGDTLYILNPGVTTEQLKATNLKDGSLFAKKIFLGNNMHKNVVFQFRLIDGENNRFLIESEAEQNGKAVLNKDLKSVSIAPMMGGWIKVQNGVPVIARFDTFQEAIAQAEVFDVNDDIKYDAVDNENIAVEGVSVVAGNGQVTIMGAAGKNVTITNILGKVIASQVIASDNATIAVPAGIVAVAVEGEAAVKAIVK